MNNEINHIKLVEKYLNRNINDDTLNLKIFLNNSYIHKISKIVSFNINEFKKNIRIFYKRFLDKDLKDMDIFNRIDDYFKSQHKSVEIGKIIAYINFQYLIVTYCNNILTFIAHNTEDMHINSTLPISSINQEDNFFARDIISNYVESVNIQSKNTSIKKQTITDKKALDLIKKISNALPIVLSYTDSRYVCYGSYTAYCLNNNIPYGDIDLYHEHAYKLLIFFMIIIYFTYNYDNIYIFSIPYIIGHISLKYNDIEILDCIYLPNSIISSINKSIINNIIFIEPGLQMLNNIRMGVELFRTNKVYDNTEINKNKYYTLLNYSISNCSYFNKELCLDILNKDIQINYEISNGSIILDLKSICPISPFDNAIILLHEPSVVISRLSKLNGSFSKKYHAFLNELFFESTTKAGNMVLDESTIIDMNRDIYSDIYVDDTKNNIYLTNYTTTMFLNDDIISYRNILSTIATLSLYNIMHKRYNFGYYLYYILLNLMNKAQKENLNKYKKINRIKLPGRHISISISKTYFQSIFPYEDTDEEFMSYKKFIDIYGLLGGF